MGGTGRSPHTASEAQASNAKEAGCGTGLSHCCGKEGGAGRGAAWEGLGRVLGGCPLSIGSAGETFSAFSSAPPRRCAALLGRGRSPGLASESVALLFPGVGVVVVAVALPEAGPVGRG